MQVSALEVVAIRFSTITEFSMMMDTINPTVEMLTGYPERSFKSCPIRY